MSLNRLYAVTGNDENRSKILVHSKNYPKCSNNTFLTMANTSNLERIPFEELYTEHVRKDNSSNGGTWEDSRCMNSLVE